MSSSMWLSFISYTAITAITPGPNNIVALNAVSNYGMRHSKRLLVGIYTGFLCVMILCGLLGSALVNILPNALSYLKYIGFVYILWLAWKIRLFTNYLEKYRILLYAKMHYNTKEAKL